jgi:hypothetical protein
MVAEGGDQPCQHEADESQLMVGVAAMIAVFGAAVAVDNGREIGPSRLFLVGSKHLAGRIIYQMGLRARGAGNRLIGLSLALRRIVG